MSKVMNEPILVPGGHKTSNMVAKCKTLTWYPSQISPNSMGLTSGNLLFVQMEYDKVEKISGPCFSLARYFVGDSGRGYWAEARKPNGPIEQPLWPVVAWMLMDVHWSK